MLAVHALVIVEVAADDLEPVILRPRDQRALNDAVDFGHRALELGEVLLDLRTERDVDQRGDVETEPAMPESRAIAGDVPGPFEPLDAPRAGRLRQTHPTRDLADRGSCIDRDELEDRGVDPVNLHVITINWNQHE